MVSPAFAPSHQRRRLTVDDLYRMVEAGIIGEKERIELIEGEMIQMTPIGPRHFIHLLNFDMLLRARIGDKLRVSIQGPFRVSDDIYLEPDVAILKPGPFAHPQGIPSPADLLLVAEFADASLAMDRDTKAAIYATYGVPEYWLFDSKSENVVIHREPSALGYRERSTAHAGEAVSSAQVPGFSFDPAEVFRSE